MENDSVTSGLGQAMIREPAYPAARTVAKTIEAHFARQVAEARRRAEHELAPAPSADTIEAIIDATFWASLRPEEGRFPTISIAFLPPEMGQPMLFERNLPLRPDVLTKLAPAVERPGIHLGVWGEADQLHVWGATRVIPSLGFVLENVEPGLLVIKHRRIDGLGKFANVAVLKGDQVKVIDERGTSLPDCPELLKALLAFSSSNETPEGVNVLVQLAASMRAHGRGGSLLVVPAGNGAWRDSVIHPITYSIEPPFSRLADLLRQESSEISENLWEASVRRAVDSVAGLTAVDGATVINDRFEVLAFGVKISLTAGSAPVARMVVTEPIMGNRPNVVPPVQHGGTRHLSAAQFVHDQRDAIALVASQDGRFTVFAWSPCEDMVHAHRVDVLLL